MKTTQRTRERIVDAVAEARDEALVEIGREAALRQEHRAGKARRQRLGKVAVAAVATGAVIAAGVVAARVKTHKKGIEAIPLSGKPETPE
jgi:hypothetical protein